MKPKPTIEEEINVDWTYDYKTADGTFLSEMDVLIILDRDRVVRIAAVFIMFRVDYFSYATRKKETVYGRYQCDKEPLQDRNPTLHLGQFISDLKGFLPEVDFERIAPVVVEEVTRSVKGWIK